MMKGMVFAERYKLEDFIGQGGMSLVYRAVDIRTGHSVAVKILKSEYNSDKEFLERFQREAQAASLMSHHNLVNLLDVGVEGEYRYLVLEYVNGNTLKDIIRQKGRLNYQTAIQITIRILSALQHAHDNGIIHRDIKPQNVLIHADGHVKVSDFGIARMTNAFTISKGDTVVGSVHYSSPEQATGSVVEATSDIYSTGVVMYEMLTGQMPYDGETAEQIALKHIAGVAVPPRQLNAEIPEELERITLKAMNADIRERYQSASELLTDLEEFRKQQAALGRDSGEEYEDYEGVIPDVRPIGTTGEMSQAKYARRRKRSRKVSIMSGAVGVLVFMIAVFVFLWNYWLRDIFSVAERIELPNFVGQNYESIVNDSSYRDLYNFTVTYSIDPEVSEGVIISQDPEAGRSLMIVPEGIDVTLTVSTGVRQTTVPDVLNDPYSEATVTLQNAGFKVETQYAASDTVTEGYVISTDPAPGEQLAQGSTIFVTISSGPVERTVSMPNLVGRTESEAKSILNSNNLAYADTTYIESDQEEGTVIRQSIDAYEEVPEHTRIYLWVSTGPAETPEPTDTAPPETTGAEGEQ